VKEGTVHEVEVVQFLNRGRIVRNILMMMRVVEDSVKKEV
jgi:hypothetical protein